MCVAPISIENPNRWDAASRQRFSGLLSRLSQFKDTESMRISVPCGKCPECTFVRQNNIAQKVYFESLHNDLYFLTLTYKPSMRPFFVSSEPSIGKVECLRPRDVALMFKRIRKDNLFGEPFKYLGVGEFGSKSFLPHYHVILSFPKTCPNPALNKHYAVERVYKLSNIIKSEWRTNVAKSTKFPKWEYNSLFHSRLIHGKLKSPFDLHYIECGSSSNGFSDVSYYVTKYILKENPRLEKLKCKLDMLDHDCFVKNCKFLTPRVFQSHGFGSLIPDDKPLARSMVSCGLRDTSACSPLFHGADGRYYPCGSFIENQLVKHGFITLDEQLIFAKRKLAFCRSVSQNSDLSLFYEYKRDIEKLDKQNNVKAYLLAKHNLSSDFLEVFNE